MPSKVEISDPFCDAALLHLRLVSPSRFFVSTKHVFSEEDDLSRIRSAGKNWFFLTLIRCPVLTMCQDISSSSGVSKVVLLLFSYRSAFRRLESSNKSLIILTEMRKSRGTAFVGLPPVIEIGFMT